MSNYDVLVIGCGFAGATIANRLAEKGQKVLIVDRRQHIGGNAYDYESDGIVIHKYGPHIFHTNHEDVFKYLSEFTDWYRYEHKVLGHVKGHIVPLPFNFTSIERCFPKEKADKLKDILVKEYGEGTKVPIMELLKNKDKDVNELAKYVFENVFKYYTMKQWGLKAEEIDKSVLSRVPVNISYDDRYFNDKYQFMPKDGYTKIFERMLASENITVKLDVNTKKLLKLEDGKIFYDDEEFKGKVYFTGQLDELFKYKKGALPYRTLDLIIEEVKGVFQRVAVENYPCPKDELDYTRITEYRHFMEHCDSPISYIHYEYPMGYDKNIGFDPYYPVFTEENQKMYESYLELAKEYPNLILIGRLAEYKYYNMDAIVKKALELTK